jgi:pantetheine hydrolase
MCQDNFNVPVNIITIRSMMKSLVYLLLIIYVSTINCVDCQENLHSKQECNQRQHERSDSIVESSQIEDGFCDATGNYSSVKHSCFRAAVVEYSRIENVDCKLMTQANLDAYEAIAQLAKEDGANVILFPEDGILMGTPKRIFPCLEEIPDPENLKGGYNPCLESNRFDQEFTILTRLSCIARRYGMFLIANFGTKEKKENEYLMLNTDVVFDPTGAFIRRYRKWNPFTASEIFSKAPKLEHAYFDTDYGRFGVFTCFDMLFREPAIELVERYHIDTALFPTWWFDELPLLTAVQYQDGWSARNKVNLLAANILKPAFGSIGSSIFSANNSVYSTPEQYKSSKQARKTKILLASVPTKNTGQTCDGGFDPKVIAIDANTNYQKYKHKSYKLNASDAVETLGDKTEGTKTVCSGELCCSIEYKFSQVSNANNAKDKLVLFARDGLRPGFYQWYEQVCALATLKEPYNSSNLVGNPFENLEFDGDATVGFEKLIISATFATKYVYPSCAHNLSKLVNRDQRKLICDETNILSRNSNQDKGPSYDCRLEYIPDEKDPESNQIYSFGFYGRVYERDMNP